ncbi:MAG: hypothetical protein NTW21_34290 [Verrucomicrobia bacterium]|nr:hypothetical protein [Verrucomicrobiota bacterium]
MTVTIAFSIPHFAAIAPRQLLGAGAGNDFPVCSSSSAGEPLNSSGGPSHGQEIDGESGADAKPTTVWMAAIPERYRHCDFLLHRSKNSQSTSLRVSFSRLRSTDH